MVVLVKRIVEAFQPGREYWSMSCDVGVVYHVSCDIV